MPYIILLVCLALALVLQILTGVFPVLFFSFPLNVILAALWLGGMIWLWKNSRKSIFVEFMLSRGATLWAVGLFLLSSLIIGFSGWRHFICKCFFQKNMNFSFFLYKSLCNRII